MIYPKAALVLYGKKGSTGASEHLAEIYSVSAGRLVNPRPLTRTAAWRIGKALSKMAVPKAFSGHIPPGLLFLDGMKIVFEVPAAIRNIFIGEGKKMRKVRMFVPTMVFSYQGPEHVIHAYWRVDKDTLTPCPMPNISFDGHVCNGTMMQHKKFDTNIQKMMERVESAFFGSSFNEWSSEHISPIMAFCERMAQASVSEGEFWRISKLKSGGCPQLGAWTKKYKKALKNVT